MDMIDVQRDVFGVAVGAFARPFCQQVFANLATDQRSLLVLNARDFRVFHELHIETNELLHDGSDGRRSSQPRDRSCDGVYAVLEGWREPSLGPAAVIEARRAVAQVRGSTTAPKTGPLLQSLADGGTAVLE